jgi:hypothetical protein
MAALLDCLSYFLGISRSASTNRTTSGRSLGRSVAFDRTVTPPKTQSEENLRKSGIADSSKASKGEVIEQSDSRRSNQPAKEVIPKEENGTHTDVHCHSTNLPKRNVYTTNLPQRNDTGNDNVDELTASLDACLESVTRTLSSGNNDLGSGPVGKDVRP